MRHENYAALSVKGARKTCVKTCSNLRCRNLFRTTSDQLRLRPKNLHRRITRRVLKNRRKPLPKLPEQAKNLRHPPRKTQNLRNVVEKNPNNLRRRNHLRRLRQVRVAYLRPSCGVRRRVRRGWAASSGEVRRVRRNRLSESGGE